MLQFKSSDHSNRILYYNNNFYDAFTCPGTGVSKTDSPVIYTLISDQARLTLINKGLARVFATI